MKKMLQRFPSLYTKASSLWRLSLRHRLYPYFLRENILVYLGGNHGETLIDIAHRFRKVYVFECNPIALELLKSRIRKFENILVFPFAASDRFGLSTLSIPSNGNFMGSASIAGFSEKSGVSSIAQFEVVTVNLGEFLKMLKVDSIDLYQSDIEGNDFVALKTMQEFISNKVIRRIQLEVWNNDKPIPFSDKTLKCQERHFDEFLSANYTKVAEGISQVNSVNWFLPLDWDWKDVLWERKKSCGVEI